MELKNIIWQEKYRPQVVEDVISPFTKQILNSITNPMAIQNFIFYSRMGGTGKTSMSKAIINNLNCDYLSLNASDERSIDTIRSKVKDFMRASSSNPNCKKCIVMDEGEKLTKDAQDALKNMSEEYSANCFIILTTNNINKLSEPLKNRFKIFEFVQPDKKDVKKYLINICSNEGLDFNEEGIDEVVNSNYPSIRAMVNTLQDLYNQKLPVFKENLKKNFDVYYDIWDMIKQQKYKETQRIIIEQGIDCEELNNFIFYDLMKTNISLGMELKLLPILARNERDMKLGCDKTLIFITSIPEFIKVVRSDVSNN